MQLQVQEIAHLVFAGLGPSGLADHLPTPVFDCRLLSSTSKVPATLGRGKLERRVPRKHRKSCSQVQALCAQSYILRRSQMFYYSVYCFGVGGEEEKWKKWRNARGLERGQQSSFAECL